MPFILDAIQSEKEIFILQSTSSDRETAVTRLLGIQIYRLLDTIYQNEAVKIVNPGL